MREKRAPIRGEGLDARPAEPAVDGGPARQAGRDRAPVDAVPGRDPQGVAERHDAGDVVVRERRGVGGVGKRARDLQTVPQREPLRRSDPHRVPVGLDRVDAVGGQPVEGVQHPPARAIRREHAHARREGRDPEAARAVEGERGEPVARQAPRLAGEAAEAPRRGMEFQQAGVEGGAPHGVAAGEQVAAAPGAEQRGPGTARPDRARERARRDHHRQGPAPSPHAIHSRRPSRSSSRSLHTIHTASQMMRRFIFENPARRSTNRIGISRMRKPFLQHLYDISIWNA